MTVLEMVLKIAVVIPVEIPAETPVEMIAEIPVVTLLQTPRIKMMDLIINLTILMVTHRILTHPMMVTMRTPVLVQSLMAKLM